MSEVFEKTNPWEMIKDSFSIFKNNFKKFIPLILISVLIFIISGVLWLNEDEPEYFIFDYFNWVLIPYLIYWILILVYLKLLMIFVFSTFKLTSCIKKWEEISTKDLIIYGFMFLYKTIKYQAAAAIYVLPSIFAMFIWAIVLSYWIATLGQDSSLTFIWILIIILWVLWFLYCILKITFYNNYAIENEDVEYKDLKEKYIPTFKFIQLVKLYLSFLLTVLIILIPYFIIWFIISIILWLIFRDTNPNDLINFSYSLLSTIFIVFFNILKHNYSMYFLDEIKFNEFLDRDPKGLEEFPEEKIEEVETAK